MELEGPDRNLMVATKFGHHALMKSILKYGPSSPEYANVDAFDGEDTPLSVAIKRKDYEAIRILLAASACPNINLESESEDRYNNDDGATPFLFAVSDPAAFAIILAHSAFGLGLGRRNSKGEAFVDCIPDKLQSEIYSLLALYFGDEKQSKELYAIARAVRSSKKLKPFKKAPAKKAQLAKKAPAKKRS